jgi:hypothetical protein
MAAVNAGSTACQELVAAPSLSTNDANLPDPSEVMGRLLGLRSDELCSTLVVGEFAVHQTEWGTVRQPPEGSTFIDVPNLYLTHERMQQKTSELPDVHPHTTKLNLECEHGEEQSCAVPGDRGPRTATAPDASPAIFEIASVPLDLGVALDAERSRFVEVLHPASPPDRNVPDAIEWMQSAGATVSEFRPATDWTEPAA